MIQPGLIHSQNASWRWCYWASLIWIFVQLIGLVFVGRRPIIIVLESHLRHSSYPRLMNLSSFSEKRHDYEEKQAILPM